MKKYQESTAKELQSKLEKLNYWSRIHSNKLLAKVQAEVSAKIIKDGTSKIISYYDEHLNYLCTIHRITSKDGIIIHEDIKDAYLDGVRYKAV